MQVKCHITYTQKLYLLAEYIKDRPRGNYTKKDFLKYARANLNNRGMKFFSELKPLLPGAKSDAQDLNQKWFSDPFAGL